MSRYVAPAIRERLFARSAGKCERCGEPITFETFEAAHLRAHSHGGPAIEGNLAAWCVRCNRINGAADVLDPRSPAREWQVEALGVIAPKILATGAATLSAAPAAGKTIFAGLVFDRLAELGFVERMVVLVPRDTLVKQWAGSLERNLHLQLRPGRPYERENQVGAVVTYQSLQNRDARQSHVDQLRRARTLLVLDEVHHVGEFVRGGRALPAWARYVAELAGTVDVQQHVAAILNLSGTLWRSAPDQRIATIRYLTLPDGKLLSQVDYDIGARRLIDEGHLRSVDLWRMGARVQLSDLRALETIDSHTVDLSERAHGRAALRGFSRSADWRRAFLGEVITRLQVQDRSLRGYHVKALVVADSQASALALSETAREVMAERRISPLVVVATSDDPKAGDKLDQFRTTRKPGVLITVDMAGEGYDCPEICVVGYASNKQTELYVRQVVARAQRVTERERELRERVPAIVVAPDVPELVALLKRILEPMQHEITVDEAPEARGPRAPGEGPREPKFALSGVTPDDDAVAGIVEDPDFSVPGRTVRNVEREFRELQIPETYATRAIAAQDRATKRQREAEPFSPLNDFELTAETFANAPSPVRAAPDIRTMSEERKAKYFRCLAAKCARWWQKHGDPEFPTANFQAAANNAAGIPPGGRDEASVAQLSRAANAGKKMVLEWCAKTGRAEPDFDAWRNECAA